jgi:hypothetical protein
MVGKSPMTRENKPLLKTDALGQSARNAFHSMMDNNDFLRDGALPVVSPRAGRVPDPMPQRGPTHATGGRPVAWSQATESEGKFDWPRKNSNHAEDSSTAEHSPKEYGRSIQQKGSSH